MKYKYIYSLLDKIDLDQFFHNAFWDVYVSCYISYAVFFKLLSNFNVGFFIVCNYKFY